MDKQHYRELLKNDKRFRFKEINGELRDGICPSCGGRDLFVRNYHPFRVQCRRFNKCNYTESVTILYSKIAEGKQTATQGR